MSAAITAAGRLDPRAARSRERVIAAALQLLREHGAAGCTIEAVAAHSGVAKTTIYRQFDDREALIFAVLDTVKPPPEIPDSGDIGADVEWTLHDLARGLFDDDHAQLFASMVDLAERSDRVQHMLFEFGARRRGLLAARLQRAIDTGDLRADADAELLVGQLVGPLFYRRFISREPASRALVTRLARTTLAPLLAPRPTRGDGSGARPRSPR